MAILLFISTIEFAIISKLNKICLSMILKALIGRDETIIKDKRNKKFIEKMLIFWPKSIEHQWVF